ncbi:hypothetical protein OH77DRAFT_1524844 [Trametes cingulata]|nr:hypothetical protein OH77DRAFT_1524844 [Trametes cingulata]
MSYSRVSRPWRSELSSTAARCLSATPFRPRRQRKLTLEDLPLELIHEIFLLACTDGGRTGCSLSLVSKAVHALSRAARFNTLSFTAGSLWQITRFLHFLEDAVDAAKREGTPRPRVRHLCVVMTLGGYSWCWDRLLSEFSRRVYEHNTTLREGLSAEELTIHNATLVRRYHSALQRLFRAVSADLESLCLLRRVGAGCFSTLNDAPEAYRIVCDGFPKLRELYFADGQPAFMFTNQAKRDSKLAFFPALTEMSVVTSYDEKNLLDVQSWACQAPNLTSLRIIHEPRLGDPGCYYLPALKAVLGHNSRSSLWPKLETVLVLYDPGSIRRERELEQVAAHHEYVKEVYRFLLERVPFAMCIASYERQDVRRELVRWGDPYLLWNSEPVWLDWLHRSAGECGAFVPNFWEDFAQPCVRRQGQGEKQGLWKRLLASLGVSKNDQRSSKQEDD